METYTRVTLSVYMPTGFDVTVYVRTEDRWLAVATAIHHCLRRGEEKYINEIYARLASLKEGATVLEPLDETVFQIGRPLDRNCDHGSDLSVAGSEG